MMVVIKNGFYDGVFWGLSLVLKVCCLVVGGGILFCTITYDFFKNKLDK